MTMVIGGFGAPQLNALTFARRYRASMGVRVVVAPAFPFDVLTLEEAHQHLQLETYGSPASNPDDDWLQYIGIPAAREYCENWCGRAFAPQTLEASIRRFPVVATDWDENGAALSLPMAAPLRALLSLTYTDADGVVQTAADDGTVYDVDLFSNPARLFPIWGSVWPVTKQVPNAITARYIAGFDLPGDSPLSRPLPAALKIAVLLELGHLYNNRESTSDVRFLTEIPGGVQRYLWPYRIEFGMA